LSGDPAAAYLAELGRLLRADSKRRRRIVHEIEDHIHDLSRANKNCSLRSDIEACFGTAEDLAAQFNALENEGQKRLIQLAVICAALAAGFALVIPVDLARDPRGNLQATDSEFVTVDPHTGAVLPTRYSLVRINPRTGRVIAAVVRPGRSSRTIFHS